MVGLVLVLLVGLSPLAQASESNIIRSFCLAAFEAAMAQAGKTPPQGMGPFTCDCFLKQVQQGAGINQARETCKAEAAKQFPL